MVVIERWRYSGSSLKENGGSSNSCCGQEVETDEVSSDVGRDLGNKDESSADIQQGCEEEMKNGGEEAATRGCLWLLRLWLIRGERGGRGD